MGDGGRRAAGRPLMPEAAGTALPPERVRWRPGGEETLLRAADGACPGLRCLGRRRALQRATGWIGRGLLLGSGPGRWMAEALLSRQRAAQRVGSGEMRCQIRVIHRPPPHIPARTEHTKLEVAKPCPSNARHLSPHVRRRNAANARLHALITS